MSFPAQAFPRGSLRVAMTIPRADLTTCRSTASATVAATDLAVARRLFSTEARGAAVARALRHVAGDRRFRLAVADDDPVALRTAIIRFFRTPSLHAVRIRATTADGRLVGDIGGPYVLAPASAPVRARGTIGRVTLSVQDDTGYIKLLHRFTGADVLLRTATGVIPGSTPSTPAPPASIPYSGTVTLNRRSFRVMSFTARAFPSGPLSVSLLVPIPRTEYEQE